MTDMLAVLATATALVALALVTFAFIRRREDRRHTAMLAAVLADAVRRTSPPDPACQCPACRVEDIAGCWNVPHPRMSAFVAREDRT